MSIADLDQSQSLARIAEIREKKHEIDELDKAIKGKEAALKELRNERKEAEIELYALIEQKTPKPTAQIKLPLGATDKEDVDSPLDVLEISGVVVRRLQSVGIERVPDVGRLIRGELDKFPGGPTDIEGITDTARDQLVSSYNAWKAGAVAKSTAKPAAFKAKAEPEYEDVNGSVGPAGKVPAKVEPKAAVKKKSKKASARPVAGPPPAEEDLPVAPHGVPNDQDLNADSKARILKELEGSGAAVGDVIDGLYMDADNSFVTDTFLFQEGEFELVKG